MKTLAKEYAKGEKSMEVLGKEHGISRERVRQILAKTDSAVSADEVMERRAAKRLRAHEAEATLVRKVLKRESGAVEIDAIAEETGLPPRALYRVIAEQLSPTERVRIVTPKPAQKRYSDAVIKRSLKGALRAHREEVGDNKALLSRETYDRCREEGTPTATGIARRFGSWNEALEWAGIPVNPNHSPDGRNRRWSTDEIVEWVRQYLDAVADGEVSGRSRGRGSSASYKTWAEDRGGPSVATVYSRLGWTNAVERALSLPHARKQRAS